jgi:L-lactate dehydrogenase (cytochrome)
MERRLPKPVDFAQILKFKAPEWNPTRRRLASALTIADLRAIAARTTPRAPFDYTDGAAEGELSLARARQAFQDVEFHPAILRDVSQVDTSCTVLGGPSSFPFGIAPTGFTRIMHAGGERAGAAAAGAAGIPFSLSTVGTTSPEGVREANPTGRNWFQLYMWKDRERSMEVVERAAAAGFDTLLVTVDVPVAGARLRDVRNGLTIPPTLTGRTVLNAIPKARWWVDFLTTEPVHFASFDGWNGTVAELLDTMFDPTVDFDDLRVDQGAVAGCVRGEGRADARRREACRRDRRRRDRAVEPRRPPARPGARPVPPPARGGARGRPDTEVHIDTGIMSGADIVAAVALGARFTLVGRAYLYGLMAGGQAGVSRAIEILSTEIVRTMKLLGVSSLAELEPRHVTQLTRMVPIAR